MVMMRGYPPQGNPPDFDVLTAETFYKASTGRSGFDVAAVNSKIIRVAASGGDYTTLKAALASITDAAADNRYTIEVYGQITETEAINVKAYVDVVGYKAEIIVNSDDSINAVNGTGISNYIWKDLTIRRTGTPAGTTYALRLYTSGSNTTFINCIFKSEVTGAGAACAAMVNEYVSPKFINCEFYGGNSAAYSYPFQALGASAPILINCIAQGGNTYNNCHGFLLTGATTAVLINCIGIHGVGETAPGSGSAQSYSFAIATPTDSNGCPTLINCLGTFPRYTTSYLYSTGVQKFRPDTSKPYQILSMAVNVLSAEAGVTLDIGTTLGGHEIASGISLATTGFKYFDSTLPQMVAGEYIYVTPSAAIPNSTFRVQYSWTYNLTNTFGLLLYTPGRCNISNSTFESTGADAACGINTSLGAGWNINNSVFGSITATQYALQNNSGGPITGAPFHNCTFNGPISATITFDRQGTATIPNGSTSVVVTHGLPYTPQDGDIIVIPTNSMGNATKYYIDTYTSTQFTINVDLDPGATTATFAWRASK